MEENNNKQINGNSVEEENPLTFIASDCFLSTGPENQQLLSDSRKRKRKRRSRSLEKAAKNEAIDNTDKNMVRKSGNNLLANATLLLAKVCFCKLINVDFFFLEKKVNLTLISFICSHQVSK